MINQGSLGMVIMVAGLGLTVACDLTLRAGKVGNKTNAPNPDGTCPSGLVVCGTGAFARCVDLQTDRAHCGSCDTACLPGIACAAGTCQQVACTGPVTVSTQIPAETTAPTAPPIDGAIFADVNGDGHPDLVTWQDTHLESWGTFQVALGEVGGGFGAASTYQTASAVNYIFAADWNSDGFDDLYVTDLDDSNCLVIWLGHADGSLTVAADIGDAGCLIPMVAADLNGDGNMDLVAYKQIGPGPPSVFLADAHGAFHVGTPLPNKRSFSSFLVRDWNGDGFPDLVNVEGTLSVYLNNGNGTFEDEMDCGISVPTWEQVVIADFNRDGHLDVASSPTGYDVGVLLGMGACQFQPMTDYRFSDFVLNVVYADVDGDGIGDFLARTFDGSTFLMRGAGDGTFQVAQLSSGATSGLSQCPLLVGEVTGDARVDVVATRCMAGNPQPPIQIQENTCP